MTAEELEQYFAELRERFPGVTDKYELWELERVRLWTMSPANSGPQIEIPE